LKWWLRTSLPLRTAYPYAQTFVGLMRIKTYAAAFDLFPFRRTAHHEGLPAINKADMAFL